MVETSNYQNNLFSNHFLEERIQDMDEWEETEVDEKFEELKKIYEENKGFLSEKLNEDQTQDRFIDPVLKAIGHQWVPEARTRVGSKKKGTMLNPDYTFMQMETQMDVHEDDETEYFDVNYAVGDAKAWNRTLDKSTQDHTNPAFQIYNYVDRLRSDWGILTNGKKWRLYSYEKCAADIYFEIDLEEILQGEKTEEKLERFKYFYLFFRAESFEQGFLDDVYKQSVEYNKGLEDSLEDKVYDALEVAVEGFFDTNDIEKTEENIDLVHHSSLIFLYRILFILNAESRDLLPTDDEAYRQAFGLTQLKRMIVEDEEDDPLFQDTTVAWDNRLSRLFEGIDDGYDLHETEIPAYNGGLFDEKDGEENQFLAENKLYGSYIKQILKLLATNYDQEKEQRVILDYKDLNIRHLGSVYEGLLEHQFKAAEERKVLKNGEWTDFSDQNKDWENFEEEKRVEENELYLTNESGERKATGSYYTPEYIVEYIVENTVGPKVEEKIEEADENGDNVLPKILELNVCDPAMGSGHFLTEATEFIAEHIVEHADLEEQDIDENEDELNWAKRQVVQNCIYGVDINPLAVELGKLSLWIETMAEGKPLNFLDHHLKHGNSLIGSDFDEIMFHPDVENEGEKDLTEFHVQFEDARNVLKTKYQSIERMDEDTVEKIHEKEQAYREFIEENDQYQIIKELSNLHTYQSLNGDITSEKYSRVVQNIYQSSEFSEQEWFQEAQQDAQNRNYFHWQLEFPKVFFGEQEGFDAVVGNPPYIRVQNLETDFKNYLKDIYSTPKGKFDIYIPFLEHSLELTGNDSLVSFIMPSKFKSTQYGSKIKSYIYEEGCLESYLDFSDYQVFPGVTTYTCVPIIRKGGEAQSFDYAKLEENAEENIDSIEYRKSVKESFLSKADRFLLKEEYELKEKLSDKDKTLDDLSKRIFTGIQTSVDEHFVLSEEKVNELGLENKFLEKFAMGQDVRRWAVKYQNLYVIYPETVEDGEVVPVSEDRLKSSSPNMWEYLNSDEVKEACKGRDYLMDKVKSGNRAWYEVWMRRNPKWFREDKILTPALSSQSNFVVDTEEFYFTSGSAGVYSIMLEDEFNSEENLHLITALLNSKPLDWYIQTSSPIYRGSYYKYNTQYLEDVPIKMPEEKMEIVHKSRKAHKLKKQFRQEYQNFFEWIEAEWGTSIDDLSLKTHLREYWEYDFDEFMRVAKKNKSQIEGSVKSREFRELMKEEWESSMDTLRPLMQEIEELENEIDAIVFDLYDLTEEEVETVLDSLDTEEGEKERILQKFGEV